MASESSKSKLSWKEAINCCFDLNENLKPDTSTEVPVVPQTEHISSVVHKISKTVTLLEKSEPSKPQLTKCHHNVLEISAPTQPPESMMAAAKSPENQTNDKADSYAFKVLEPFTIEDVKYEDKKDFVRKKTSKYPHTQKEKNFEKFLLDCGRFVPENNRRVSYNDFDGAGVDPYIGKPDNEFRPYGNNQDMSLEPVFRDLPPKDSKSTTHNGNKKNWTFNHIYRNSNLKRR